VTSQWATRALAAAAVLVATGGAALAAVVGAFLVPLRIAGVPVPVCFALAAVGAVLTVRFVHRVTGSLLATAAPTVAWFAVTVVLAARRPEGDLIVTGSWVGVGLLFVGSIAFAVAVFIELTAQTRRQTPVQIDADETVTRPAAHGTM
jgi:hypothetical protein